MNGRQLTDRTPDVRKGSDLWLLACFEKLSMCVEQGLVALLLIEGWSSVGGLLLDLDVPNLT